MFNYENFIDLLSIFVLLSAIHGIFLSIQIVIKSRTQKPNYIFALLILIISIHLIEILIGLRGYTYLVPHIDGLTFPLIFAIGPLYYLYVSFLTNSNFKLQGYHVAHFLPTIVILYSFLPYYFSDTQSKIEMLKQISTLLKNADAITLDKSLLQQLIFHTLQLTAYLVASFVKVSRFETRAREKTASANAIENLAWLKKSTLAFGLYTAFYFAMLVSLLILGSFYLVIDTLWLFLVSLFIHFAGYAVIHQPVFKIDTENEVPQPVEEEKYKSSSLTKQQSKDIHAQLLNYMRESRPFTNDQLRLSDVADDLNLSTHILSQVINQMEGMNFFDFVNKFRIEESIRLMKEDENQLMKILTIAFESGFNNKVSFNRSFKKITGQTPSHYRKSLKKGNIL